MNSNEQTTKTVESMRINLPSDTVIKIKATIAELRTRGVDVKPDDLLKEYLLKIDSKYLEEQISHFTPDDYYLEAIKSIPEIRELLIQKAKKAYQKKLSGKNPVASRKKKSDPQKKKITQGRISCVSPQETLKF